MLMWDNVIGRDASNIEFSNYRYTVAAMDAPVLLVAAERGALTLTFFG